VSLPRHSSRSRKREPVWATYSDDELLKLRFKDLKLTMTGTWVEGCLEQMHDELSARGIAVRAHAWLSTEWFSPHDTPGIAVPFYLAHPRLARLERKMMLEVEGGTVRECMRILRHEAGHVVQRAYGLHRRNRWRRLFGSASKRYPEFYRPNPTSQRYVQHLRRWYAQCHPDEDFAETFAVWLQPRSKWRKRYADWPALQKLNYVDELMGELQGVKPPSKPRTTMEPLHSLTTTLGDHYREKQKRFSVDAPTVFDRDLKKIFSDDPAHRNASLATAVIRRHRAQITRSVARETGEYPIALDHALDDIIDRSRALKLRAPGASQVMRRKLTALLTAKSVTSLYSSGRRQTFAV
jgi:hypothetical protein